ncbi:MAG: CopD family protein [Gammaproteobacteria bacterium]|nr:CopD family protein [Gammaproteobacteria bacterium]
MFWIKALHIIFMVTWFAGLFYLPRLYVYHAGCHDETGHERFLVMERKLFIIMTIGAVLTAVFGVWALVDYAWAAYRDTGWLATKLLLVGLLIGFHFYCWLMMKEFRTKTATHSHVFYRWVNEIPTLLLIAIVLLTVVKPF